VSPQRSLPRPRPFPQGHEDIACRNLNAYLPFGAGPRMCVGSRFALQEARTAVALLHRRFAFELSEAMHPPGQPLKLVSGLTLAPVGGVWVKVTPRAAA
jgi:carlactone C-19 oxidase